MYEWAVKRLQYAEREHIKHGEDELVVLCRDAARAIEELRKRNDFLMNCIYEAEDSLDRGADNDWARAALEKAERGQNDV